MNAELDAWIGQLEAALEAVQPGNPAGCLLHGELGGVLLDRFSDRQAPADLDAAVSHLAAAGRSAPAGYGARGAWLAQLGGALSDRFALDGRGDLDAAVEHLRLALAAVDDAAGRLSLLRLLGLALSDRFNLEEDVADLELMLSCLTEAREGTPPDHPERMSVMALLGAALGKRFEIEGDAADLDTAAACLSEAIELLPAGDPAAATLGGGLAGVLRDRFVYGSRDPADLDRAASLFTSALASTAPEHPERVDWQMGLGLCLVDGHGLGRSPGDLDAAVAHLNEALQGMPEGHPHRGSLHALLGSVLGLRTHYQSSPADLDTAIAHLVQITEDDDSQRDPALRGARMNDLATLLQARFQRRGAIEDLNAAVDAFGAGIEVMPYDHPLRWSGRAAQGTALLLRFLHVQEPADLDRAIGNLTESFDAIEPTHPHRLLTANNLGLAMRIRFEKSHDLADLDAAAERLRAVLAAMPSSHPDRWGVLCNLASVLLRRAMERPEPARLNAGIEHLNEALRLTDARHAGRPDAEMMLGAALALRFQLAGDRADLDAGIDLLTSAQAALAGQAGHPFWPRLRWVLGEAYRWRGDPGSRAHGRRIGLEGLLGWSWDALLQSGTGDAVAISRFAAEHAVAVAAWCLADGAMEDTVQALELGRGLVLHAATVSASVPKRLRDAGREDLAAEWERTLVHAQTAALGNATVSAAAPGDAIQALVPSDLRHRVLRLLAGEGTAAAEGKLLRAPSLEEIREALATIGADALVYLVSGTATLPGGALIVRADGAVRHLALPELGAPALDAYLDASEALRGADRGVARQVARSRWLSALSRLCSWAWEAVMGPLLGAAEGWNLGREPWLVLVPVGRLGMVPWHAAVRSAAGRPRYALEDAVLSCAPSARLLCEVAHRRAAARDGRALVVGNPTGDLHYAAEEARAVLAAFYPEGVYLGRSPSTYAAGPGVPEEVLAHMAGRGSSATPVLHLACHAVSVSQPPGGSYLRLAGTLTVEDLLEHARGRGLDDPGAMVVLSACRTDVPGRDYDEALSIATGFLVAGASTVVGSLWQVSDRRTALLMFMFHHYVNRAGLPSARALRMAQLWMLDPDRTAPTDMPAALACRVADPGLEDPYAWAAFLHRGR
jgi:tetratricopeptide (TPR) repeat protein